MIRLRRLGGRRGQVLVIFGVSAVALFAVLALAIDGGRMLMDQRALQAAGDGAALLAASDIGPGADATQRGWAQDDAVLSVERSLAISFSNNYVGKAHRLTGGAGNCKPSACSPPWSPTACCTNWADTTNGYLFSITTPLAFGTAEPEAVVRVKLVHHMPLLIGGSLWPTIDVTTFSTARNYAIPYAIFTFKHNDKDDLDQNGGASLTANKRIGANGTASRGSMTFTCLGEQRRDALGHEGEHLRRSGRRRQRAPPQLHPAARGPLARRPLPADAKPVRGGSGGAGCAERHRHGHVDAHHPG
jgi:putative Flp pilus-assembly TadE/G-like protein